MKLNEMFQKSFVFGVFQQKQQLLEFFMWKKFERKNEEEKPGKLLTDFRCLFYTFLESFLCTRIKCWRLWKSVFILLCFSFFPHTHTHFMLLVVPNFIVLLSYFSFDFLLPFPSSTCSPFVWFTFLSMLKNNDKVTEWKLRKTFFTTQRLVRRTWTTMRKSNLTIKLPCF